MPGEEESILGTDGGTHPRELCVGVVEVAVLTAVGLGIGPPPPQVLVQLVHVEELGGVGRRGEVVVDGAGN